MMHRVPRGVIALCAVVAAVLALGAVVDRSAQRSELEGPALRAGMSRLDASLIAPEVEQKRARQKKAFRDSDGRALQRMVHAQRVAAAASAAAVSRNRDLAAIMHFVQKHDEVPGGLIRMVQKHDEAEHAEHDAEEGEGHAEGGAEHEEHAEEGEGHAAGGAEHEEPPPSEEAKVETKQEEMALAKCDVPLDKRPPYCELLKDIGADLWSTAQLYPTRKTTSYRYKDNEGGYGVPRHSLIPVRLPNARGFDLGQNVVQFGLPDHVIPDADAHVEANLVGAHKGGPLEPILRTGAAFQQQDIKNNFKTPG